MARSELHAGGSANTSCERMVTRYNASQLRPVVATDMETLATSKSEAPCSRQLAACCIRGLVIQNRLFKMSFIVVADIPRLRITLFVDEQAFDERVEVYDSEVRQDEIPRSRLMIVVLYVPSDPPQGARRGLGYARKLFEASGFGCKVVLHHAARNTRRSCMSLCSKLASLACWFGSSPDEVGDDNVVGYSCYWLNARQDQGFRCVLLR